MSALSVQYVEDSLTKIAALLPDNRDDAVQRREVFGRLREWTPITLSHRLAVLIKRGRVSYEDGADGYRRYWRTP